MRTHVFVYVLVVFFSSSTYHRSFADIGSLLSKDSTLPQLFRPTDEAKSAWRFIKSEESVFFACESQDWLQSKDALNSTGIRELTIKVTYKHRPKNSRHCLNKTAFFLRVLQHNDDFDTYSASGKINKSLNRVTSIKRVPVNYPQLHILIRPPNKNDCMVVYSVHVTYNFCRKKTFLDVAHFPQTFSPRNGSKPLKVEGWCSYGRKKPVAYCDSKGEWWFNETLPCDCAPGEVISGMACVELSSIIEDMKTIRLSNTRAVISWKQKTLPNIRYDVLCKKCKDHECDESCTGTVRLTETKSVVPGINSSDITGLERGKDYLFVVVGRIGAVKKNWNETSKQVKLEALPEEVKNLTFTSHDHSSVALTWLPPSNIDSAEIFYEIACQVHCLVPSLSEPCTTDCKNLKFSHDPQKLLQPNVTINGFKNDGRRYVFKVLAKHSLYESSEANSGIEWNFVAINYTDSKEMPPTVSKSFNVVDVIIGVSVLILAVVVTIIATRCYNRWKRRKHTLSFDDENPERFTQCEVPLTDITTHYVDPSNYDSVENVLRKFTTKLNERNLKTEAIIGEGEFGVVWKGYLETNENDQIIVAVKCLRSGLSAKLRRDFLAEASVMGQFKDPNVISLHGVVVKKHTVKIVMEFMSNGSLDQYLVKNSGRLTTLQLLGIARGIASGMKYLSGRNFIHRDLAARNILVDENLSCKVSDFGLTREICQTSNYETRGGKIPIRWTAPEVIKHRKSFIASDVWSYGVVLWEIMSFGQRPYWEWDNFQVLQEIETGYRLPAPPKCPKNVHSLMLHCWEKERSSRPTFLHILDKLDEWIRSPETIHHSPAIKAKRNTMELIENPSPIHEWLNSIKMGKYAPNFFEAGYNRLSQIVNLNEQDLSDMGITLVGHRHKIHQSIPLVT